MPSVAWKLAAAAFRAATARRAAAVAARSRDGSGAVMHPHSPYHLISDPSTKAPPRPPIPPEFNDEEAYLPADQRYMHNPVLPPSFNSGRPGGCLFNIDMRSDKKGMPFDKKDLESEQTLWALYNRWLSYFNLTRGSVERGYRFKFFKEKVDLICEIRSDDLKLNHLCDVHIDELCPPKRFLRRR